MDIIIYATYTVNKDVYNSRQQADFGTCYVVARAYSLEQQNAGRAHAGLCHVSSFIPVLLAFVVLGIISSVTNQKIG